MHCRVRRGWRFDRRQGLVRLGRPRGTVLEKAALTSRAMTSSHEPGSRTGSRMNEIGKRP
jgi:hypothetical protein